MSKYRCILIDFNGNTIFHHDSDFSLDFCSKILFATERDSFRILTIYYLIFRHGVEDHEFEFKL